MQHGVSTGKPLSDIVNRLAGRPYIQDLTRFVMQAKGPDGKWTMKPLAYRKSNDDHLCVTRPPEICVDPVFKHILVASSYTISRQFVPFLRSASPPSEVFGGSHELPLFENISFSCNFF